MDACNSDRRHSACALASASCSFQATATRPSISTIGMSAYAADGLNLCGRSPRAGRCAELVLANDDDAARRSACVIMQPEEEREMSDQINDGKRDFLRSAAILGVASG